MSIGSLEINCNCVMFRTNSIKSDEYVKTYKWSEIRLKKEMNVQNNVSVAYECVHT